MGYNLQHLATYSGRITKNYSLKNQNSDIMTSKKKDRDVL